MAVSEGNILLGSGDLFLGYVPNFETATSAEIEAALVNVGAISGGAALAYKPTMYDVKSANRGTIASFLTDEEVTFKSGILTFNLENITKLSAANYSTNETNNTRRIGIGGLKSIPLNYLRFVHTKPTGEKLTVNIFKAQSQNGFELTFDKEKETVLDMEFKALSALNKTDGTLVEIIEELAPNSIPTMGLLGYVAVSTADFPKLLSLSGTNFKSNTVVIAEKGGVTVSLRTFFDSTTSLTAEVKGLTAGTWTIKVKTGLMVSATGQSFMVS